MKSRSKIPSAKTRSGTARSIKEIGNILIQVSNRKPSLLLIAGEFNIKEIDWETEDVNNEQDHLVNFLNDFQSCFLYQHVREPTRYRLDETSNLLDLIITNEDGMVPLIEHHPGIEKSDHDCLIFDLKYSGYISKNSTITHNFYKGNYTNIKNILATTNCASILNGNQNDSYKTFSNIIEKAIKENIPSKSSIPKSKNIFTNREALKLKCEERTLEKKYRRTK